MTNEDREKFKRTITLSQTDAKKAKQAERRKKLAEDYQKNRDPIKEFF